MAKKTHTQHDISQASPIGDEFDSQNLNPIGDEEQKQIPLDEHDSEKDGNPFNGTDALKSLDDHLFYITGHLPEFQSCHGLVSSNILGLIDDIVDPKTKH